MNPPEPKLGENHFDDRDRRRINEMRVKFLGPTPATSPAPPTAT